MKRTFFVMEFLFLFVFLSGCAVKTTTAPITQAPTTLAPTTQTPTTVAPTTQAPTTQAPITYTITWDVNGLAVEVDLSVVEGTTPAYNGVTPQKPATAQYTYAFTGWSPTITTAQSNQTYVAQFSETINQYTIQFNSNSGTSVSQITQNYGELILEPIEPTRLDYRFMGWYTDVNLTEPVEWPLEVTQNQTLYAGWNEVVPFGDYLSLLLSSYSVNPYGFIPESMIPGARLVSQAQLEGIDYSTFVTTSAIPYGGFGEQWNMVTDNLAQAQFFFDLLTVVDTLASLSVTTFNNYLDTNPVDTAHYNFLSGIYSVTISFEDNIIYYVLDYTAALPVIGEQTIQIALSQNIITNEKEGRIQAGDANALRYVMSEDGFQFAIKYAGIRRAYFEISSDSLNNVEGRIFEYLGSDEVFTLGSAAQFFITSDYVSVVGNKSSSMLGWEGTINELYSTDTGILLGYEIRETFSSVTYNTLWFNLDATSGIDSIKFLEAPVEESNPYLVYINDQEELFISKNVGGISLKTLSRRYDIELRVQYFFYEEGDILYQAAMLVPMIFVQEEQLSTFEADVNSMNDGLTFSFNLSTIIQNKIMDDYDMLIDNFIVQKEEYTTQLIIDFIGTAYTH